MFRRLTLLIAMLLTSSITCQAAQHIAMLGYLSGANMHYFVKGQSKIWTKSIAGGVEAIWRASPSIDMQGGAMYFQPTDSQIESTETLRVDKTAMAMNVMAKLYLRPYIDQAFSFDIENDNFYSTIGIFMMVPSIVNFNTITQIQEGPTKRGLGTGLLIGAGYKYNFSTKGVFDIHVGRIYALHAGLVSTWIVKAGVGMQLS